MAKLDKRIAVEKAQAARRFLAAFNGQNFGEFSQADPYDRRNLAIALDHLEEMAAMALALADMVPNAHELTNLR